MLKDSIDQVVHLVTSLRMEIDIHRFMSWELPSTNWPTQLCVVITVSSAIGWFSSKWYGLFVLSTRPSDLLLRPMSVLTYGFLHIGPWHLIGNLVGIYLMSFELSHIMPKQHVMAILALGTIGPAVLAPVVRLGNKHFDQIVGASCGLFALLGAMAAAAPDGRLMLFFVDVARLEEGFMALLGVSVLCIALKIWPKIWHFGHLVGGIIGFAMIKYDTFDTILLWI
jgi:membrane associated rhomboid family serine protease